jgi:ribose 5-phosphate isomerase A
MTIYERALDFVPAGSAIGLGSGRAARAFVQSLGRSGLNVRGVPTSEETAHVATEHGVQLTTLDKVSELAVTVDGADEVDPKCNLIKGWGRALVRERIVAAASRRLVILVSEDKLVARLGTRGKLPVEVVPFAVPLVTRKLDSFGLRPALWNDSTDNGNRILDCAVGPIDDPESLDAAIRSIPGVVGTGLFLNLAPTVLIGDEDFKLISERNG